MSDTLAGSRPGALARLARLDRVWAACLALVAAVVLVDPYQGGQTLEFLGESWLWTLPFVIGSSLLAAAIAATGIDRPLASVLSRRPVVAVVLAGGLGALSPFCSVSVVPVVAGLLAAGVPLAPVMAFWVGSPLIDPEMFLLTAGIIGLDFAVLRTLTAVLSGLAAGFLTLAMLRLSWVASPLRANLPFDRLGTIYDTCSSSCGGERPVMLAFWRDPARRAPFWSQARAIGLFMAKWLTLAFIVQSLLLAWVPADDAALLLGGGQWWTVPLAALIGVPTYLNGYAAVPVIDGLLKLGMEPGAAIAFLIGGEVTSLPTAMAVFAVVRGKVFALYLALGLGCAMAMGWATQVMLAAS